MALRIRGASPRSHQGLLAACVQGNQKAALNALRGYRDLLTDSSDASGPKRTRVALYLQETDSNGLPPLLHAVKHGWVDVLKELIELGANASAKTRNNGNSALHLAALHKQLDIAKELCSHLLSPTDADARNVNGDTPLMFACGMGCLGVASLLLQSGADPGARNSEGITPVLVAAGHGHDLCLKLIQKHTGQEKFAELLKAKDQNEANALHFASSGGHPACLQLLLENSCDAFARNALGKTPLQLAMRSQHTACVRLLEAHMKQLQDKADAQAEALMSPISPKPPRPQKLQRAKATTTPARALKPLSPSEHAEGKTQSPTAVKSPSIRSTPGGHLRLSSLKSPGLAAVRKSTTTTAATAEARSCDPLMTGRTAAPPPPPSFSSSSGAAPAVGEAGGAPAAGEAGGAGVTTTGYEDPGSSAHIAGIADASQGLVVTLPEDTALSPSPASSSSSGSPANAAAAVELSPGSALRDVPASSKQRRDVGSGSSSSGSGEGPGGEWVVVTKHGGKAGIGSLSEGFSRAASSKAAVKGVGGAGRVRHGGGRGAAAAGGVGGGRASGSKGEQGRSDVRHDSKREQRRGQTDVAGYADSCLMADAGARSAQQQQQRQQQQQQQHQERVKEQGDMAVARALQFELEAGEPVAKGGVEVEDGGAVGLNGEMCWWWAEAQRCISAGCPAAQALDVQPQHVLGVGLDQLSTCQLEALEAVHRHTLAQLSEVRIRLANEQHEEQMAEKSRLREEIQQLAQQLTGRRSS